MPCSFDKSHKGCRCRVLANPVDEAGMHRGTCGGIRTVSSRDVRIEQIVAVGLFVYAQRRKTLQTPPQKSCARRSSYTQRAPRSRLPCPETPQWSYVDTDTNTLCAGRSARYRQRQEQCGMQTRCGTRRDEHKKQKPVKFKGITCDFRLVAGPKPFVTTPSRAPRTSCEHLL